MAVAQDVARGYAALDRNAYAATKKRMGEDVVPRIGALIDEEFPA